MSGKSGGLQKVGKALMTPIAVLPAMGLLLRFGVLLDIPIITAAGNAIFNNLAVLFAIGVAFGLAKNNQGAAALSGYIAYEIMVTIATEINPDNNMGVLAGMISGIIAGLLYNRFYNTKLPDWLGFFGGKRSVPIITSFVMIPVGVLFGYVWPIIQKGLDSVAYWITEAGAGGVFVFGTLNRLLIPFGLHHVLNSMAWFTFGTYDGKTGDLNRFFAGDPTAGSFMTGFFPVMMFGMPAVALAIYFAAKKKNRPQVSGMLFSVALTAVVTGITEPLEFLFMFLAPVLYAIHAVLTGVSLMVTYILGIHHGFTFSAGLIDYVVNWNLATKPFLIIPVGIVFFAVYFVVFRFAIEKLDLPTPGRLDDETGDDALMDEMGISALAKEYIALLGGKDNIRDVDACITRLRLTVNNNDIVTADQVKALGASGLIKPGASSLQIVVGTKAEIIADEMKQLLNQ